MNKSVLILLTCVWGLPLAAQEHATHDDHATPGSAAQPTDPATQGQAMQGHMQAMQEQMARIHATQDPAERQRLMQQHMQSMQANMAMMGRMGRGHAGAQSQCGQSDTACRLEELQMQHGMMQDRIGTMQQMMEQLMLHMQETQPRDTE